MKSLLVKLGVILIGLAIFSNVEVWGADWKVFAMTDSGIYSCDVKSITRLSANIVRVWVKTDLTQKGRIPFVKDLGESYENLTYQKTLYEIDCAEKKFRVLQTTCYNENNEVIPAVPKGPTNWDFVIPESIGEALYKEVCK